MPECQNFNNYCYMFWRGAVSPLIIITRRRISNATENLCRLYFKSLDVVQKMIWASCIANMGRNNQIHLKKIPSVIDPKLMHNISGKSLQIVCLNIMFYYPITVVCKNIVYISREIYLINLNIKKYNQIFQKIFLYLHNVTYNVKLIFVLIIECLLLNY